MWWRQYLGSEIVQILSISRVLEQTMNKNSVFQVSVTGK